MTSFGIVVVLTTWVAAFVGGNVGTPRGSMPLGAACGDSARITWVPRAPRQGALFRVRVTGAPTGAVFSGTVAGEALHFANAESFAAIPIDARDTLGVMV